MAADVTESDPFDRLYSRWAERALLERRGPPSRERWDAIVLRLILSEDPERVRRYRRLEATGSESLGADAYELWSKTPDYTPNLTAPATTPDELRTYEEAHRGSMKRLMEAQGLLDRYNALIETQGRPGQRVLSEADKARARRAQSQIIMMGCAGLALIGLMMLALLLIIALNR